MHECSGFRRPRRGGAAPRFTYTSDPGTKSCAFTVSLLLTAATPDRDGQVRHPICHLTVAVRSRRRPPRAHSTCTSLSFHCMHLVVQTHIHLFSSAPRPPKCQIGEQMKRREAREAGDLCSA